MRAGGEDVSNRDVTIAQMENGATECGWRHAPKASGGFWKVCEWSWGESCLGRRLLTFACSRMPWAGVAQHGGRWKSQNRKKVYLSPYVEEPLNSKVIKCFLPEQRSRKYFRVSRFLGYMYVYTNIMNVRCTFHVSLSGYGTQRVPWKGHQMMMRFH